MPQRSSAAAAAAAILPRRPPGRPRSQQARSAILRSTLKLLHKTTLPDLTIEAIAADAGVGKATVYRWWPSKAALVADAFSCSAREELRYPDTGSVLTDLSRQMKQLVRVLRSPRGKIVAAMLGGGVFDPELTDAFRERFMLPRRREAMEILERGIRRGELPAQADLTILLDSLYGPVYFRFLMRHEALTDEFIDGLCRQVMQGATAPD